MENGDAQLIQTRSQVTLNGDMEQVKILKSGDDLHHEVKSLIQDQIYHNFCEVNMI